MAKKDTFATEFSLHGIHGILARIRHYLYSWLIGDPNKDYLVL